MRNSINSIILLSCQKFHNIDMNNLSNLSSVNSIRNVISENIDFDELDEMKRKELLAKSGKPEVGQKIDFKNDYQKRYYQGTTAKGSHEVPSGEFYVKNGKNYKAGDPKMLKISPAGEISATAFDIPTFEKTGDLILIYSFKATNSGNVKDNPNQRTFIHYEGLAQKASEILKKSKHPDKLSQKSFESAIEKALEEVDITVNCECRDFVQRFMKPAKKQGYYFNPKRFGINTEVVGATGSDIIQGTGKQKNPEKDHEQGNCKHIIKALANKRDRILRAKFGKDNVIGIMYDSVLNSEKNSLLYNLFIKGTNKDKLKMKDSYSFDSVMELAKEWINSNKVSLISGIQAEKIMEDMTMKYSDELEDYSVHAGKYNGIKVCIVETPTSIYSICDRDDDLF